MNRRDVAVLFSCLAVILAIGGPLLLAARDTARDRQCLFNLRQMGIRFYVRADKDPKNRLCTGATDWLRDGCPTEYGWVADVLEAAPGERADLKCPSNSVVGLTTLNDLIGVAAGPPRPKLPKNLWSRYQVPDCGQFALRNVPLKNSLPLAAGSPERIAQVEKLIPRGMDTNYVPSWFLTRSSFRLVGDGKGNAVLPSDWSVREVGGSEGPLTMKQLESSNAPASIIPLICDAAPIAGDRGKLSAKLDGVGPQGSPLGATLTGGPVYYHEKRNAIVRLLPGKIVVPKNLAEEWMRPFCEDRYPTFDKPGDPGMDGKLWLQDTRQWKAIHGQGDKKYAQFLMADGSVKRAFDRNGDGYINPGFAIKKPTSTYRDDTREVNHFEIFLGGCVPYWGYSPKGTFE